jgi:hypothetical protein
MNPKFLLLSLLDKKYLLRKIEALLLILLFSMSTKKINLKKLVSSVYRGKVMLAKMKMNSEM